MVWYVDGFSYSYDFWIEFSIEAHASYKCTSFSHAVHMERLWVLVVVVSNYAGLGFIMTLAPTGINK